MARCKWIDATIWYDADRIHVCGLTEEAWNDAIKGFFKEYAYGREDAPSTGRRHIQFRGCLLRDRSNDIDIALSAFGFRHISPTVVKGDYSYVYKDGDYYLSWEIYRPEFDGPKNNPHEWQVELENLPRDDRSIEILIDKRGNWGKTAWAMYMSYLHKACYIPPVRRGIDVSSCVINKPESEWYIVDTPRAFEFDEEWATAIEQLKNGYVFDTRHSFKDKYLKVRPRVTILCNLPPDYERYFSADRVLSFGIKGQGYLWSYDE